MTDKPTKFRMRRSSFDPYVPIDDNGNIIQEKPVEAPKQEPTPPSVEEVQPEQPEEPQEENTNFQFNPENILNENNQESKKDKKNKDKKQIIYWYRSL